jgi:hypothetical protein
MGQFRHEYRVVLNSLVRGAQLLAYRTLEGV